jgi:hypothetical protein
MNYKDKEAFEKWFKDFYEVDFNAGDARFMGQSIAWKYACEYMRNRSPLDPVSLYDKLEKERERSDGLVEALEKLSGYVPYNGDTQFWQRWVKEQSAEALKKYRGEK